MSTWTDVTNYIKTQLRPGVLGNTNVQKILNSVLAVINQINAGDFTPTPDALWQAGVTYAADTQPVLWQDQWLVSNIADNLGNVPINTSGVIHPTWRVIGSSSGSGIRIWTAIVYPNTLEVVFFSGGLYYLNRAIVGDDPFVSVDFAAELAADKWLVLTGGSGTTLSPDVIAALAGTLGDPSDTNRYVTAEGLGSVLDSLEFETGRRVEEVELIVNNTTSGDLVIARWYNDANVFREILALPLTFIGSPSAGNFRWDLGFGNADGTYSQGNGTEGAEAIKPDTPVGAVVLYEILWNSAGEAIVNPNPGGGGGNTAAVFPNVRYATAVAADTTGKYAKIMEINLSKAQDYSFTLDYGSPGTLEKNKAGRVHVAFVCTDAKIIHGVTVTIQTVGFSQAGDFVLVQLAGNKAALYHKSTNYWMRLQWRVTFMNSAMKASDFINNQGYGSLAAGDNWQSEVYGGSGLPAGGTTGQILTKNSETDGDASWQDAPAGGGGGATRVVFSTAIDPTGNFFSEHNQTAAIAYTLGAGLDAATQFGNKTEHYIEANGTGGKPTFSADFVVQMDTWSNNTGDVNCLIFKVSKTGKIMVWLDNIELA